MLGWFQALMPKEQRFFDLFERHAEIIVAGAGALRGLLEGGEGVRRNGLAIAQREAEADEITRLVLTAVRRTFITPFDRSDITGLITSMDDAIDQMNRTVKVVTLFEVEKFDPPMREMGDIIVEAARLTAEAVPLLAAIGKNAARLNVITEKMIEIEECADQLHEQGRKELYKANKNGSAMAFIVGTEIYDNLEKIVDRFEDVANEITAIVIEHV